MSDDLPWLHVAPGELGRLDAERRQRGEIARLVRRGVDHGAVVIGPGDPQPTADPDAAWRAARPVHLPGVLDALETHLDDAVATWHAFERCRDGGRLLDEIDARLGDDEVFAYSGSTFDHADRREVEKVFVDVPAEFAGGGRRIRDLSAKLSWVAEDETELSMRIRFSFGHEATKDWLAQDVRAAWSDRLTERAFPETRVTTRNETIRDFLGSLLERPHRLSECILFSVAPGGGITFHHDADPGQHGVVYAQLLGATVWLAVAKRELAAHVAAVAEVPRLQDVDAVLAAMENDDDTELRTLLDATPALTARLAAAGHLFVVRAGDALLLPSHDVDRCAWHSVFGVGGQATLGLSFGVFDALPELPGAPPAE